MVARSLEKFLTVASLLYTVRRRENGKGKQHKERKSQGESITEGQSHEGSFERAIIYSILYHFCFFLLKKVLAFELHVPCDLGLQLCSKRVFSSQYHWEREKGIATLVDTVSLQGFIVIARRKVLAFQSVWFSFLHDV
ncbi:hypothetical protein LOK49_LG08G00661 [Camellia lanceoleosa]|uniref:Uncharacterized protein n=1 Tax=Camellia lanceoleosa TaxID=1840588 RepID=A0ACC0GLM7_9ERIC|nr:hypothetical protein LOK49_LG08G00661 [Camellia lanceoleosa]